jgi:hypothetical protein
MSSARAQFLLAIHGLNDALSLDPLAAGAIAVPERPGIAILRRGMLVAALIALETFIRDRTSELLERLSRWPASYEQLPQRFRDAALLNALSHLQRYALMLKRQQEDYESEIISQVSLMASYRGPVFGFSKFISGDHTGNLSEEGFRSLVSNFQIGNCWEAYKQFSAEVGFGIPSVKERLNDIVRKRHRSAHAAAYCPTSDDITTLPSKLTCLSICFDVSMTASVEQALAGWEAWTQGTTNWRNALDLYLVDPHGGKFRVFRPGSTRALRVLAVATDARATLPRPPRGRIGVMVTRGPSSVPQRWDIL